ncbi:glycosyltransferase family 4 protein [Bacillus sp. B-jedd]|uniref:glycosyltransferase family 4 protein n=1 Tax=Bacillus sp. B-jedd TaxID=1476857 RepID=UPI0005156D2A|nr:glycosyltransferase family 4 protein [Bacillus sp. B-jedd]CEG28652.1 group 1 glycosyl transferase [Bacillus sp. B-jedd]
MRKILYITTLSRTINSFLVPHIEKLINEGNIIDCACSIDEEADQNLANLGVRFFDVPFTRNPLHPVNGKAFIGLMRIQKQINYDIVHVHTPIAALYGRLLKLRFPKLKTIYTAHGFHFYKGAPLVNWGIYYPIEKVMARYTDTIITMNTEDYERAKRFKVKGTHLANGVGVNLASYRVDLYDRNEVRRALNLNEDDFVIIMIAEVNKNKNHKQVIDAVNILKQKGIHVKVICAGDGPLLERLKMELLERELEDRIHFLGNRDDITALITASDLGILMSYREGLPRNIMELMACRKPVIGTKIRGIRDLVKDKVTGFLVNVEDAAETAQRIEVLYRNRDFLEKMGSNAYESIKQYDVKQVVDQLVEIYGLNNQGNEQMFTKTIS